METADWIKLGLVVLAYLAERAQFFSAESRKIIRRLVQAVNTPQDGKTVVKESPESGGFLLNRVLDKEEPWQASSKLEAPRVSKKRMIGRFLVGLLPGVSRLRALKGILF